MTSRNSNLIGEPKPVDPQEPARPIPGISDRARQEADHRMVGCLPAPADSQAAGAA